jgi:Fe-S-cluster-containing dehydrogenase component
MTVIVSHGRGREQTYVKRQCMHCLEPACVSACMLGAFQKGEHGIVTYDSDRCIGCRYCQIACPFNVPRFEWSSALPRIVKCELCRHRIAAGQEPACAEACPRDAVTYGRVSDLRREAVRRLRSTHGKYYPYIYGWDEAGGTQVLYLAGAEMTSLGLPALGRQPVPALAEALQHGIYRGFVVPVVLYVALAVTLVRNRKRNERGDGPPEEKQPPDDKGREEAGR